MSRIDLCIFGATGFTGKNTVREIINIAENFKEKFTWCVAGRNKEKLKSILEEIGRFSKTDTSKVPIIVADIENEESLCEMAKKVKVVLNCCGPYRFYGEPVVKACIFNKTHHVDVSGEPQYMERMQLHYNEAAKENEVYAISACGIDSVPADLGVVFLKDKFEGEVNLVDIYMQIWCSNNVKCGLNFGTWESAVYGLAHSNELHSLRKALYPKRTPQFYPKQKYKPLLHKNKHLDKWCLPFLGSDRSVVRRTQRYFYDHNHQRPIQVNTYIALPNMLFAFYIIIFAAIFSILTRFQFGRNLLLKYPELFSWGVFSHKGPTNEQSNNTHFAMTLYGEGWNKSMLESTEKHATNPDKKIITKVSGTNPGYGMTCVILICCGLTVLKEAHKMPDKGGIYPPGAAFAKTQLVDLLNKYGVTFEVVEHSNQKKKL